MTAPAEPLTPPVARVADAVGALIESWGFKRNMGRMWAVLYLESRPLSAAELGERLGLSAGAVSMLLGEMQQWGAVKKAWVVGERREHYEPETSIWKLVSRVLRERELQWVRAAHEAFETAATAYAASPDASARADGAATEDAAAVARRELIGQRIAGLAQLAQVGARLLEAILEGESVDALPIKTVGELAQIVGGGAGRGGATD
jgi:DNA-binding transcriptional regulator GbsR (MarR family)